MKKNFLYCISAAFVIFTANAAFAQIGIKAGATMSSLSQYAFEDDVDDYDEKSTTGFQAGIFAELPISEGFSIQPELLWMQKGGKTLYTQVLGQEVERNLRYNYLEVPILAKVKAGSTDGTGIGLFFYGGPFISYALNGNISTEVGETKLEDVDIEFDDADDQRRVDWGAAFGLGVNLGALMLDLRYDLGINNLLDDSATAGNNGDDPYLRTRSIGLSLGFVLGAGQ